MEKLNKVSLILFIGGVILIIIPFAFISYYISHISGVTTNEMIRTSIISYVIMLVGFIAVFSSIIMFIISLVKKKKSS